MLLLSVAFATSPLDVLEADLARASSTFATRADKPHHIAVALREERTVSVATRSGTLIHAEDETTRWLDVDLRVGTPELDSTHPLRGFSAMTGDTRRRVRVPTDDGYALRHALARELDVRYREAAEHLVVLRANRNVRVEEEASAPDFEPRAPVTATRDVPELVVDRQAWVDRLSAASARADRSADVHDHDLQLQAERVVVHQLDTEGTRLQHGRVHARLSIRLGTTAADGDQVEVFDAIDVHDPADLPTDLGPWVDRAVARLEALRRAPRAEPFSGPVMLEGRAAGVFFHEVLGHRVEGHRQKREDEGQTFADHIGQRILPPWLDVVDDPTVKRAAGVDLNGHYAFDDEGVPPSPAVLVDDGVFEGFLMSRSPLPDVPHTNGHGRRSPGNAPLARMGNTLVTARQTMTHAQLRSALLDLVRAQGLPYGMIVEDIEGGFALTGRTMPNAFNIRAVASWRVYADGRPDELVRGIDLVGTPFVAFANLVAASDTPEVFNGTCGAESGWVPVSAVAPALLFDRLEFQLKEKGQDRPPLLPKPPDDGAADGGAP